MFQLRWLWANLKGSRAVYICALVLSVVCNAMFVAAQFFQSKIIDTFVSNKQAAENLRDHRDLLLWLIAGMIGVTLLRTSLTYTCNMYYEKASQAMIYRIRTHLFRKIENQDMDFYDRYRTGDLMTRLTGDLDMVLTLKEAKDQFDSLEDSEISLVKNAISFREKRTAEIESSRVAEALKAAKTFNDELEKAKKAETQKGSIALAKAFSDHQKKVLDWARHWLAICW